MYVGSTCVCVCAYTYAHLFTSPRCASLLDFLVGAFCKDKLCHFVIRSSRQMGSAKAPLFQRENRCHNQW